MHDLLFAGQADWQDVTDPTSIIDGYATKIGLDMKKFTADMASDAVKTRVATDLQDATTMALDYTTTLFINGKRVANPQNYEAFKTLIETAAQGN